MAAFEYSALNARGRKVTGIMDAESKSAARDKLRKQKLFPISLRESMPRPDSPGPGRLADFSEKREETKKKIQSALAYPAIMAVIGFLVLVILFMGWWWVLSSWPSACPSWKSTSLSSD